MMPLLPLLLTAQSSVVFPLVDGDLRIDAISETAFRVRFSPTRKFAEPRVPVLLSPTRPPQAEKVGRFAGGGRGEEGISTPRLSALYNLQIQVIRFTDHKGNILLSEKLDGRRLQKYTLQDPKRTTTYRASQDFQLQPNEAIYGLGQHQSGLLNYRGSVVKLEQQNREIAIPFLLSSRGYGILWNNAAYTEVGVGALTPTLPDSQKLDAGGKPGGLTVEYFAGQNFEKPITTLRENKVDHDWAKNPVPGVPKNDFSVRWTGFIQAKQGGVYDFQTTADDGARLWIDDKPVIDDWSIHPPTTDTAKVKFAPNSRHKIRLEYFQGGGGASMQFTCGYEKPSD